MRIWCGPPRRDADRHERLAAPFAEHLDVGQRRLPRRLDGVDAAEARVRHEADRRSHAEAALPRHTAHERAVRLLDAAGAPIRGHRPSRLGRPREKQQPGGAAPEPVHRDGLGVQAAHAVEQGVVQEAAVRQAGQAARLGDRQERVVAVEDCEAEGNSRLLPRRPTPRQALSRQERVSCHRERPVDAHLAGGDPGAPHVLARVPVSRREPRQHARAARLAPERLAVLEAAVHRERMIPWLGLPAPRGPPLAELLVSCQELAKAFGAAPLFEGLALGVFEGDHVGLVGPNGSGKSTLLKILAGLEPPSAGTRSARKRLRIGYVPQDPVFASDESVGSVLREALAGAPLDAHELDGRVAVALGRAGFADESQPTGTLSGGWKKRLAIARELVRDPELLLLDEPTNHLDVEGILWLEELLPREPEAFVAVSHDRYFLEAVAGRVIELNRAFAAGLFDVRGGYSRYLEKKDELLAGQAAYQESLTNRVRGELDWLSRKARARTRKAQARIDEAHRLQEELGDLDARGRSDTVALDFSATQRRTQAAAGRRGPHPSLRRAPDRERPRARARTRRAPRAPGSERHRQEHAPAPARRPGAARRGHASSTRRA